jgi:hypothetical protein
MTLLTAPIIPSLAKVPPARTNGFAENNIVNIVNPIPLIPPANPTLNGEYTLYPSCFPSYPLIHLKS